MNDTANRGKLRSVLEEANVFKLKIDNIIKEMKEFSFEEFRLSTTSTSNQTKPNDVFWFFLDRIKTLENETKIKTAFSYQTAMKSVYNFCSGKKFEKKPAIKLPFSKVTTGFLFNYERWMLNKGASVATIGIYMRTLRAIVNIAKKEGYVKKYPLALCSIL
jgi:hypothetical protein